MRKPRVIVYDDDNLLLGFLAAFLSELDYEVITFNKPGPCPIYEVSCDVCNKPCSDIIITDYRMPGMTGVEMLRLQSQRGCWVDTRNKAIMSGGLGSDEQKSIRELGYNFFGKPFPMTELTVWLDECKKRIDLSKPLGTKRKECRYSANIDISFNCNTVRRNCGGTVINISDSGLCVKAYSPIEEGHSVVINTELPTNCKRASVQWVRKMAPDFYMAGLSCHSNAGQISAQ